jgi:hypothetical protein
MLRIRLAVTSLVAVALLLALTYSGGRTLAGQKLTPPSPTVFNQEVPPEPTDVLVCYSVRGGDDVRVDARLVTQNFGGDLLRVRSLVLMCEQSVKYRPVPGELDPPPPVEPRIYACYAVDRGSNPDDPYILETRNFGQDGVIVQQSNLMCEAAEKLTADGDVTGAATGHVWQCFKLMQGDDPNTPFRVNNQNFGRDDVKVATAVQMCETAAKHRLTSAGTVVVSGEATGDVVECFRIQDGQDVGARVVLTTLNFGRDEVELRSAVVMCEPAVKTPVYVIGVAFNPTPTPTPAP